MAEAVIDRTSGVPSAPVREATSPPQLVRLQDGRIGQRYGERGQMFSLGSMLASESVNLGGDKPVEVYFKTGSGNIYRIDESGKITDIHSTQERGSMVEVTLDSESRKLLTLAVGGKFIYGTEEGKLKQTSRIQEIVAVTDQHDIGQKLAEISFIIEDFNQGLSVSASSRR